MALARWPQFWHTKGIRKTAWITCYDYSSAVLIRSSAIDGVLVGDSAFMTLLGHGDTLQGSLEFLAVLVKAVAAGLGNQKWLVADLPFGYLGSYEKCYEACVYLMKQGAHAIKIEGTGYWVSYIRRLVKSGIPIFGHVGLTPQSYHTLGGFKTRGKTPQEAETLIQEAQKLEQAGVVGLVLECVTPSVAREITQTLGIPVIGIGSGLDVDGQILVWHDVLGLNPNFKPPFVRWFTQGFQWITQALNEYSQAVHQGTFPSENEVSSGGA